MRGYVITRGRDRNECWFRDFGMWNHGARWATEKSAWNTQVFKTEEEAQEVIDKIKAMRKEKSQK